MKSLLGKLGGLLGMKEPVGVDTDVGKLEKWLAKTDPGERAVLSIVGFGGVGKAMDSRRFC